MAIMSFAAPRRVYHNGALQEEGDAHAQRPEEAFGVFILPPASSTVQRYFVGVVLLPSASLAARQSSYFVQRRCSSFAVSGRGAVLRPASPFCLRPRRVAVLRTSSGGAVLCSSFGVNGRGAVLLLAALFFGVGFRPAERLFWRTK